MLRYRSARYEIQVENPRSVSRGIDLALLDGEALPKNDACIRLTDDGATHQDTDRSWLAVPLLTIVVRQRSITPLFRRNKRRSLRKVGLARDEQTDPF